MVKDSRKHIVALSGGKDSTATALRLAEVEPRDYEFVFTPTGNEPDSMVEHWLKLGKLLGKPLKPITCGHSLGGLIRRNMTLPNWRMRWCTVELKIKPFEVYLLESAPCTVYVGLRADEEEREGARPTDYKTQTYQNLGYIVRDYPLRRWGWGISDVLKYLECRGVQIPERTDCNACFFQTLYEWWALWKYNSRAYAEAEGWEKLTGHTLRSPQRDSHPAALRDLRKEFEAGFIPTKRMMKDRPVMCSVCSR